MQAGTHREGQVKLGTDERPKPGDIVLLRGTEARVAWAVPHGPTPGISSGHIMPGALGLVVTSAHESPYRYFAYVLWSTPCVCGWIQDGCLRKV